MTAEQVRDDLLERFGAEGIVAGRMFGSWAILLDGKVIATFHGERAVFKLGRDSALLLDALEGGAHLFDPSGKGRAMKDWLVVEGEPDLDEYLLESIALQRR